MAETKIKAGQFFGVIGHGTDGYFLMTNADGSMSWAEGGASGPSVTSVDYPGDDTAADPAGGQTVVLTGTNFGSSMTVSIGGTTAPSVAHDSSTQLTITTPAKAAGDYDIVVTNTVTGASGTFVNGISYNGVPTWTTAAGSLGTFESETTISTITLQATEPDGGTITFNITNGALPTGLSLTGANIDGTTTAESSTTLYSFTIEAIDDENQATPRNFSITVNASAIIPSENFTINTYTGNGSTQSIEGKIGTAAAFNGSSSYIEAQGISGMGANDFTYSCWFNTNSIDNSNFNILTPYTKDHFFYGIQVVGSTIGAYALNSSGGGQYIISNSGTISTGTWYHIAYVKSSTAGHILYLNGSVVASDSNFTGNMRNPAGYNSLWIGNAQNIQYFNGSIDQVRVFNKALSLSEVTTLYGENNASLFKSTTDIFGDGSAVALYEFEEGAKDTGGVNGYIGAGGVFNGSSSKILLPKGMVSNTEDISVSFWVQGAVAPSSSYRSIYQGDGNDYFYITVDTSGEIRVYPDNYLDPTYSRYTTQLATTNSNITDGDWHHIVVVNKIESSANGGGYKIYVDGSENASASFSSTLRRDVGDSYGSSIGSSNSGTASYYEGRLDQVRIFNKALSSSEVTTLYGETSASATKSTADIFDDGSAVALYELEGNANDTALYGRGAIDEGQSAVFNRTGNGNTTSSAIYLPNNSFNSVTSYSLSTWVNIPNFATSGCVAFSSYFYNGSNEFGYKIYTNTSGNLIVDNWNPSLTRITSSSSLSVNKWYNIVITNTQSQIKIYIDGVLDSTNSTSGYAIDTTMLYTIGGTQYNNLTYDGFNGKIDQVRIYSSILSASDVEALVSETNVPTANLVAHYKLDGNGNDETGNYNAASVNNVTYSDPAEFPTYDGTATNVSYAYDGTPTNVSFVGTSFQPDLVWIKRRDDTNWNMLTDSVRGSGKTIFSNDASQETTNPGFGYLSSFDSNGFTITAGATNINNVGANSSPYAAWCWKAGGSVTPNNNTDGSITSTVSANPEAGFSIVKYDGATNATTDTSNNGGSYWNVGHGLSSPPEMVIVKKTNNGGGWYVGALDGWTVSRHLILNTTDAQVDRSGATEDILWGNQNPTSTTFGLGGWDVVNRNGDSYIAYCFHSVDGYQKVGSYTGGTITSSNIVNLGFRPRWIMFKNADVAEHWVIYDSIRDTDGQLNLTLYPDLSNAEAAGGNDFTITTTDDGFYWNTTAGSYNRNSQTNIYLAIA